jgi:hypothetical protein
MPHEAEAEAVRLIDESDGSVIAEAARSDSPTVDIRDVATTPRGDVAVEWAATDPDDDELFSLVDAFG